ncbi:MAG: hypothetical protein AMQ74_01688 [Candidatus Methanofastidiosum methylothiophilum]|uniref:Uncharacterized protein n=1 Tax=Candidatus Methanofastidiosum methylothiophilum TaxID=1705564 RepID=A0A150IQY7_9EURY|nr:MAG: hypothetical protein AMQ74_01688 [Candidatus Methanofastidiosum methylthiophilus]
MEEQNIDQTKKILLKLLLKDMDIKKIHKNIQSMEGEILKIDFSVNMEKVEVYFKVQTKSNLLSSGDLTLLRTFGKLSFSPMQRVYTLSIPIVTSWKEFV